MIDERIHRINELYRKAQTEGLTQDEKIEQINLRKDFASNIRNNFRNLLNNIDMENADGSVENLGEKYGNITPEKNSIKNGKSVEYISLTKDIKR